MPNNTSDGLRVWHPLVPLTQALKRIYAIRGAGYVLDVALAALVFAAGDMHAPWMLAVLPLAMRAQALVALACTYGLTLLLMFALAGWMPHLHVQPLHAYAVFVATFACLNRLRWHHRLAVGSGLGAASALLLVLWQLPVAPPHAIGASACVWAATSLAVRQSWRSA